MQARFGPWNLDLQKLSKNRPKILWLNHFLLENVQIWARMLGKSLGVEYEWKSAWKLTVWFYTIKKWFNQIVKIFVRFRSVSSLWICWVHSPISPTPHPGTGDGAARRNWETSSTVCWWENTQSHGGRTRPQAQNLLSTEKRWLATSEKNGPEWAVPQRRLCEFVAGHLQVLPWRLSRP